MVHTPGGCVFLNRIDLSIISICRIIKKLKKNLLILPINVDGA